MENSSSWEQKTLANELIQGMELAKQLRRHLNSSSVETRDSLVQRILSSYEKSLLILNWSGMGQQQHNTGVNVGINANNSNNNNVPESPLSMNGSPRSDDFDVGQNDVSKKRKTMPRWTHQVKVSSDGLEGPHDDGYSWRKYGQKDILGAKYPRSYYRCTYRNTQNCWATKQVQRSDEDPTIFEITYRGLHACAHGQQVVPPPASPEKQEQKQAQAVAQAQAQAQATLSSFQKGLRVKTDGLDSKEMEYPFSFAPTTTYGDAKSACNYSPSFISPTTPEPNCFSVSPFQMNNFITVQNLPRSDSDFTEIISANTSATNSPIIDPDFSLQGLELDPNFPFDTPGFFSELQ